ncbi:MAG TPA: hypothetical protein DEP87_03770, partial [Candidatus Pacebacteria bacterium]|nr:hypothetical protein [Candidatus Paceibacterota bacterium]
TLEKKQLVLTQKIAGQTHYGLTTIGRATIEAEMPALASSVDLKPEWSLLVFQQAPRSDRNFRYLRQFLLQHRWFALTRGVFVYPGMPAELVMNSIQKLYAQSVLIVKVEAWVWGDIRLVIGQGTMASQVDDIYSGISREIDRLIGDYLSEKDLDYQAKQQIVSTFNRLYLVLEQDFYLGAGLHRPANQGRELLGRLQLLG